MSDIKLDINLVEITKINVAPGDVLLAKVKGKDFESEEVCDALKDHLKSVFPGTKIGVLFMEGNEIDFTVISQETAQLLEKASLGEETSCNPIKTCDNCNCGKKVKVTKVTKLVPLPLNEEDVPEEFMEVLNELKPESGETK